MPGYYTGGRVPGWYQRPWRGSFVAVQTFAAATIALAFLIPLGLGLVTRWPAAADVAAGILAAALVAAVLWRVRHETKRRGRKGH